MNADAFRHFYEYHFTLNRMIWDQYITQLSVEQFTQPMGYSHASVRDQLAHLMDVDDVWFSELRGVEPLDPPATTVGDDRAIMRAHWDRIEQNVRDYLAALRDDMLFDTPIQEPDEDRDLIVWQVLLHVVNHGTDHRAQLLRFLNELGIETTSQDYIFFAYERPAPASAGGKHE